MSRGYNKVVLLGGLTKDPELKQTNNGTSYLRFSLACAYAAKGNDGQWTEKADYVPCMAWGNVAETIDKYCIKGSQIFIEGKVFTNSYKNKDGRDIWDTSVRVDAMRFAGGKRKDDGGNKGGNGGNNRGTGENGRNSNFENIENTGFSFNNGPSGDYAEPADIPF